jgi:hypothetical protein
VEESASRQGLLTLRCFEMIDIVDVECLAVVQPLISASAQRNRRPSGENHNSYMQAFDIMRIQGLG